MEPLASFLKIPTKRDVRHEKEASAREIVEFLKDDPYPFGFWLKKIGKASYGDVLSIIKEARAPHIKNRGSFIAWKLKTLSTPRTLQ